MCPVCMCVCVFLSEGGTLSGQMQPDANSNAATVKRGDLQQRGDLQHLRLPHVYVFLQ